MTSLLGEVAAGTWSVDAAATCARFTARDVLRKPVVGTLPVLSGGAEVSPDGLPVLIWADLDLSGVDTGNARRDRDLRGRRFFGVDQGGVLRFTATAALAEGAVRWLLDGQLALRETRCPLPVHVEMSGATAERIAVRATATLDRRAIGIDVPRLLVGRTVDIAVEAVLTALPGVQRA